MSESIKVKFVGHFANGDTATKEASVRENDIVWVATQFAEVNSILVKAYVDDVEVYEHDARIEEI
ncbi:Dmd discriminator of mRNA degradation [Escherichia phage WG01]|uniref:Discriminator of mRNA degradation n=2 Tax=Dhakavirus TaxID=1914165 RepID=A0A172Q0Y4_9CAUD|nr:Dmd discriminator of mRNA degradation [Escherichia phage Bp7]YP_009323236.1 Dmd discriminator of mRNA degradation [Escherichia phage WG01]QJA42569.1 discriminator of mRNA degradation [Enterobacteria phage vB_EcoM_IME540]QXV72397.1 antitoxin [Shigella phage PSD9]WPJ21498.1 discriminator of mRNA degradation [Salmonella phage vB_SalD_ABTNLS3]AEN93817.1 discriminator of mRNA degradation [Escherichia phage Bp7]AND75709.1 discriminator of mRNA degradation [Escherichia phage WG01]